VFDDFLAAHGLTLESFATEMNTGWLFGYVEALRVAGADAAIVCVSRARGGPLRHPGTGVSIIPVAPPAIYRRLSRYIEHPHGRRASEMFGQLSGAARVMGPALPALTEMAPYLATPAIGLARELRRIGAQAILCQEYEFPRFDVLTLVSKLLRIPVYATFQGGSYQRWRAERRLRPVAIRACDGLIIPSAREIARVKQRYRVPERKLAQIPNPVDVSLWRPGGREGVRQRLGIPDAARVVIWHGRVELEKKGLDVLLQAWSQLGLSSADAPHRLVLVGDGPDSGRVRALIRSYGAEDVVFVNRYLSDPEAIRLHLVSGDVYVFPSRHEGMAVAPLEAMACGLPLIAADVSGVRESLPEGEGSGGIIIEPERPVALAAAMRRLLADVKLAKTLGRRARHTAVSRFSLEAVGGDLVRFMFPEFGSLAP
jgi:glycosyltransferase involved in cell wall biosynthesis